MARSNLRACLVVLVVLGLGLSLVASPAAASAATDDEVPGEAPPPPERSGLGPSSTDPTRPSWRSGFLAMPFLGFHSLRGDHAESYGLGLRIGALLGGWVSPNVALGGDVSVDDGNIKNVPNGVNASAIFADVAFNTLFNVSLSPTTSLLLGPRAGVFWGSARVASFGRLDRAWATGLLWGGVLAVVAEVTPAAALAFRLSYEWRDAHQSCVNDVCGEDNGDAVPSLSLSLALIL